MWGWDLNPNRLTASVEPLSYWNSWCFDTLVREKLTVTFLLPGRTPWEAGGLALLPLTPFTSSSSSDSLPWLL